MKASIHRTYRVVKTPDFEGLPRADTQADHTILVHGGAAGAGKFGVQLAQHFFADIHTTGIRDTPLRDI